jgi:hypothetical protein
MRLHYGALAAAVAGALALPAAAQQPAKSADVATPVSGVMDGACDGGTLAGATGGAWGDTRRGLLESDRAFPGFVGPISNPVLSKDPRSLTEARLLFINDELPPDGPLGGGDFQVYAMQLRLALTDRLTLTADKDGIAHTHFHNAGDHSGLLNMALGLKYLLVRDVEDQFLWSAGFCYEVPTGERSVLENHGDGVMTAFTTVGKEVGGAWHVLDTFGYQSGMEGSQNSDFFYNSLHIDRQIAGWLYPLVEVNWFHYTHGGSRGLPPAVGEGDGLLNLGTSGVAGNDLVTFAVGMKAKLGEHIETGAAWEFPLSNRHDLIDNRLTVELVLRF